MNLSEARVLITGGGAGLGLSMVRGFLADGAQVGVLEKDAEGIRRLKHDFTGKVKVWNCDVTDIQRVEEALSQVSEDGFGPNVLINNAGIIHSEPLVKIQEKAGRKHSTENWKAVIACNLDSVFYVTSSVVDRMLYQRSRGVVISISSISAAGNPGQSAYSASKAAVNALTKTWAKELGGLGIRFAAVAPGFCDTQSSALALGEVSLSKIKNRIPLRKLGSTGEIYLAVRSIVENEYINGAILNVDGGLTI